MGGMATLAVAMSESFANMLTPACEGKAGGVGATEWPNASSRGLSAAQATVGKKKTPPAALAGRVAPQRYPEGRDETNTTPSGVLPSEAPRPFTS
jgi:hypothetical protein